MDNSDNYEIIDDRQSERELKALGLEVRRQGQGKSKKELVFDPLTGEFVLGDDGVRGSGDIVTQMTEDGFAAGDGHARFRYNDKTGDFEPMRGRGRGSRMQVGTSGAIVDRVRNLDGCDMLLIAGGIFSTLISNWIGGVLIATGIAKKLGYI